MNIKIALAGNPNCGKTTLFNALTGSAQYVGNWPGVTVERKEGRLKGRRDVVIQDLPGIYSLSPYTMEEVVARNYLIQERPDAVLNIVDGTNMERSLYLTTQLLELGLPVVVAVNMMDLVEKQGGRIDIKGLGEALGCPVVELSALKNRGIEEAVTLVLAAARGPVPQSRPTFQVDEAALEEYTRRTADIIQTFYNGEADYAPQSTDSNIPLSLGIPANTIGTVLGDKAHTREEWVELNSLPMGLKIALSTVLQYAVL